jgi:hypothetical protein
MVSAALAGMAGREPPRLRSFACRRLSVLHILMFPALESDPPLSLLYGCLRMCHQGAMCHAVTTLHSSHRADAQHPTSKVHWNPSTLSVYNAPSLQGVSYLHGAATAVVPLHNCAQPQPNIHGSRQG